MRDAIMGTYDGEYTYCPVNACGACPYCDKNLICHVEDPVKDCDDWAMFWGDWDEWKKIDWVTEDKDNFAQEEIEWAKENYGYEEPDYDIESGFDPFMGCYTEDC